MSETNIENDYPPAGSDLEEIEQYREEDGSGYELFMATAAAFVFGIMAGYLWSGF